MTALFGLRGKLLAAAVYVGLVVGVFGVGVAAAQPVPAQTVAQKIAASDGLLDINTATVAQLKALPGMGDAYARRVIAGRPYTAKNQLTMRGILPVEAYNKIKVEIIAHRVKK